MARNKRALFFTIILILLFTTSVAAEMAFRLPENLTKVEEAAFINDVGAEGLLDIPEGVNEIGAQAFYGCMNLTSILLPKSLQKMGEKAFYACIGLSGDLVIPAKLSAIPVSAFENCVSYDGVLHISEGVKSIGKRAFRRTNFQKAVIPATVTSIAEDAFDGHSENLVISAPAGCAAAEFAVNQGITWEKIVIAEALMLDGGGSEGIVGRQKEIHALFTPADTTNRNLKWYSTNPSIATVSGNGEYATVNFLKAGTVSIFASTTDGSDLTESTGFVVKEPIKTIALNQNNFQLQIGQNKQLAAIISPENAASEELIWKSSTSSVATVDSSGRVSAVSPGQTVITVTVANTNITASCQVKVVSPVTGVSLNKTNTTLNLNGSETLIATVVPANADNRAVSWKSSNTSVVTVDSNGKITAVGAGSAVITVTTADGGKSASCNVTVKIPVTGVTINKTNTTINLNGSETLTATVVPTNAQNRSVNWKSSNTSAVTVDSNGKITAVGAGSAVITVTTVDGGKTASCNVKVNVPVTGITLNKNSTTINLNSSETLTATISPSQASNKNVTWTSSDTGIATVANGTVKAVGSGVATITATTADGGKKAACTVKVHVPVTGVSLSKSSVTMNVGESVNIGASVAPANASNASVSWSSSNTNVATVSNGLVTAKGGGSATITVTTSEGGKKATCNVTVNALNSGWSKLTGSNYAICRTRSTGHVSVYTDANLKTIGIEGQAGTRWIDGAADDVYVYRVGTNAAGQQYAYISYPASGKRCKAYLPLNNILAGNSMSSTTAKHKFYIALYENGSKVNNHYVDAGDTVYILKSSTTTGKTSVQIMYPISNNNWFIGWCCPEDLTGVTPVTGFDPIWPAPGVWTVTCLYKYSSGAAHSTRFKYGIDIAAPNGTNIVAVESGTVIVSEYSKTSGFGNWIMIQHNNGKVSLYAHLSSRSVSVGQSVSKGQSIGKSGNSSAKYNIGYHLHFELGNSNTSGAAGDPWMQYFKPKYGSQITLTQAAAKYNTP